MRIIQLAALFVTLAASPLVAAEEWSLYTHDGGFHIQKESASTECMQFNNHCTKTKGRTKPKALKEGDSIHWFGPTWMMELVLYANDNCTDDVGWADGPEWDLTLSRTVRSWLVRRPRKDGDGFDPGVLKPKPSCGDD